ncbi:hypothetical protein M2103_000567 [Ereboglobus sp. PH5-5]|uniref:DUF6602 domain-containing protein n=1 Tax=Ereboglobus sp. PH5-5 TaxID=2940529 RepID=UPI0024077259|nr:DUF6602 domain-containing protein [Ereboglobus sp. PH5-5]MDF9832357.1 hypothetical protein [Ereboglobus sp. PH5-5]
MSNRAKSLSKKDGKAFLQSAFASEQALVNAKLKASEHITHNGDMGEHNEQLFIDLLQKYLPNRYTVAKAIILDSLGHTTDSIDIVIFDRQYTPTLLDKEKHRYVPAEAVYAVFECKPTINKGYLEYAADKAASVRRMHRTSVEIPHAGGLYKPKPHIDIVSGILALDIDWSDGFGASFKKLHTKLTGERRLDCGLAVSGASFDTFDNTYTFGPKANALVFFLFRLLKRLQSVGTVPAIDWAAYAQQLSE